MFNTIMYPFGSFTSGNSHTYSVSAVGVKFRNANFNSREAAKDYLGHYLNRKRINVKEKWRDGHYVTYVCDNNVKFFINRI